MNVFDASAVQHIWEFAPLPDITIKVLHEKHPLLDPDEYLFVVPVGTTVGEIKEKLLARKFRKFGWLRIELKLWACRPHEELADDDDFEDDTTVRLTLDHHHHYGSSDDEESDESEEEVEDIHILDEYFR